MINREKTAAYEIPDSHSALTQGPDWLQTRRGIARLSFNESEFPPRTVHLWRYTDPARFLDIKPIDKAADFSSQTGELVAELAKAISSGELSAVVTDCAGREVKIDSSTAISDAGITILPLSKATNSHSELLKKHLYTLVNESIGKFEALNGALWNDGVLIHIPAKTSLALPIHILHEAGPAGTHVFSRVLVVVEPEAELTIIDEYLGGPDDKEAKLAHTNGAVEIIAGQASRVQYLNLQRYNQRVQSYLTQRASVDRDAVMHTIPLALGGKQSKQLFGVDLIGAGADSNLFGLAIGSGVQFHDNHTRHHHRHGQTTSRIDFKVVLSGKSESAYSGLIRIDRSAPACEAYQENRNLLLSPNTRARTIPELEILNEDVSCSHGATVGEIDPEQIFYLAARGMDRESAIRMIVSGFVAATLDRLPENLRTRIGGYVTTRLEEL